MKRVMLVVLVVLGAVFTNVVNAAQVPVNDIWGNNGAGGEWNLYNSGVGSGVGNGIMEYLYGVGNFTRLDDSSLKIWSAGNTTHSVGIAGVYAGASENLYTTGLGGVPQNFIINPGGTIGQNPSRFFNTASFTPASDPFLFLDHAIGYADAYSDPALNGGIDRMVAFTVTGYLATPGVAGSYTPFADGLNHYVLGFEDGGDADYQDLVVEVSGVTAPDAGSTLAMLSAGLGLLAVSARRMRK